MNTLRRIHKKTAFLTLLAYLIIYYGLMLLFPQEATFISDIMVLPGEAAALTLFVLAIPQWKGAARLPWIFFAAGFACYALIDFIWAFYDIFLQRRCTLYVFRDICYILNTLCFFSALALHVHQEKKLPTLSLYFDVLISITATASLIFNRLPPVAFSVPVPSWAFFLPKFYPIFDIGYLTAVFSLLFSSSHQQQYRLHTLYIGGAFFLWAIADLLFLCNAYASQTVNDFLAPLWPISGILLATAACIPLAEPKKLLPDIFCQLSSLFLPYFLAAILMFPLAYHYLFKNSLVTGALLTCLLLIIRQIITLYRNDQLIQRLQESKTLIQKKQQQLEAQNQQLQQLGALREHEAYTDFLTGLFNRRYMRACLQKIGQCQENSTLELCVLLIDVDYFKQINDTFGHQMGDCVLQRIAKLIQKNVPSPGIAGRFGGDEFILILPQSSLSAATKIAAALLNELAKERFAPVTLTATLSIGITYWQGRARAYSFDSLVTQADQALYKAKSRGRNQYQIYAP